MAKVVIRKGRNLGAEYKLNAERLVMGRRSACPIPILDAKASREHAIITRKDGAFFIHNVGRNGSFLNEQPISTNGEGPTPLKYGDKIRIGNTVLEVVDEKSEKIEIEIPGYKIMEKIGRGGMGTVYKAKQLSMDRTVALKVLNEKYSSNTEFVNRFIREARAAGKLNHPNVIHVHDVSKAHGRHYFSMEYVDGLSVKEKLRIEGKIPTEEALDIVLQTAKALEFAHENGIVHRDIKPDNLMLTHEGVVKIADLGIAKSFEESGQVSGDQNKVMGSPHYMAPEQALGKDLDHRVDIYSLGATFYHMLTGTTPFTGTTAHEVLKAHIQDSLPPIQEFSPNAPDPVCFIIERMMAKLPEKRYPHMTRVIEDLERSQQGIEEGIERIDAGESTIMRAITTKERRRWRKNKGTEDIGTGLQTPVKNLLLYAGLAVLFVAVVAGVVIVLGRRKAPAPAAPGKDSGAAAPATPQVIPEAQKKLADARSLLAQDSSSASAEALLREILSRYPAWTGRDEADKLLQGIARARRSAERKKAQEALNAAKRFEAAHRDEASQYAAIAAEFGKVLASAANVKDILEETQRRQRDWTQRHQEEQTKRISAELQTALRDAEAAQRQRDYDLARQPLQTFLTRYPKAPQGTEARAKRKAIEDEAAQAFNNAKAEAKKAEKDPSQPIPMALAVWADYVKRIKDAKHRPAAEAAQKALLQRAQKFAAAQERKIAGLAKAYQYEAALQANKRLRTRLAGTPWEDKGRIRQTQLTLQRDLHKKILKAIAGKTREAPLALPFKVVVPKMQDVKGWAVSGAQEETLDLDALPKNSAPGINRRFREFTPAEQYKIYLLFLPSPTPGEQRALAAFCRERGLNAEAKIHEAKAAKK